MITGQRRKKAIVVTSVAIFVALLHFLTGPGYKGPCPKFVNGYLLDILLPFTLYLLLCLQDRTIPFLRSWINKALPIFVLGCAVECAQFYGAPVFGQTFDPLDMAMYGVGVLVAAGMDILLLPRVFHFWRPEEGKNI